MQVDEWDTYRTIMNLQRSFIGKVIAECLSRRQIILHRNLRTVCMVCVTLIIFHVLCANIMHCVFKCNTYKCHCSGHCQNQGQSPDNDRGSLIPLPAYKRPSTECYQPGSAHELMIVCTILVLPAEECRKPLSLSVTQSAFAPTSDRLLCFPGACIDL